MGEDSIAILLEVRTRGEFQSGKPSFWYWFVKETAGQHVKVEHTVAAQMLVCALVFSRILWWLQQAGMKKTFWGGLVFVALAPHTLYFISSLYPDGVFAVSVSGVLFECWLILRTRSVTPINGLLLFATLPFAVLARTNGIALLVLFIPMIICTRDRSRLTLGLLLASTIFGSWLVNTTHPTKKHDIFFPLVVFETVNFLQPRAMNFWYEQPRVSKMTTDALERHRPLSLILSNYDRDYWDPLNYKADGPLLGAMPEGDKRILVHQFFTYNIWQNIPAFLSSRVNVFLVSALAEGNYPGISATKYALNRVPTGSIHLKYTPLSLSEIADKIFKTSEKFRWILWSPLPTILLLMIMACQSFNNQRSADNWIVWSMTLQFVAIFTLSIAGEYRYLYPFFAFSLVALSIYNTRLQEVKNEQLA